LYTPKSTISQSPKPHRKSQTHDFLTGNEEHREKDEAMQSL